MNITRRRLQKARRKAQKIAAEKRIAAERRHVTWVAGMSRARCVVCNAPATIYAASQWVRGSSENLCDRHSDRFW